MPRKKKVNSSLRRKVLGLNKANPHLGVRKLADLLKEKYGQEISKTTIHRILKDNHFSTSKKGRKKYHLLYERQRYRLFWGIIFLILADCQSNFSGYLAEELKVYFPRLRKLTTLKTIILLMIISSYLDIPLDMLIKDRRLSYILRVKLREKDVKYFLSQVHQYQPQIYLKQIREMIRIVSTLKLSFSNGEFSLCDASFSSLFDSLCKIDKLMLPCYAVNAYLEDMLSRNTFLINFTQSFGYISQPAFHFIKGLRSGIEKIEFLDEQGNIILSKVLRGIKPDFVIGYHPRALNKGVHFLGKIKRKKKLSLPILRSFYWTSVLTRFLQNIDKKGLIINNVLLYSKKNSYPVWGMITNKAGNLCSFLKYYLRWWPYPEVSFSEKMKYQDDLFSSRNESLNSKGTLLSSEALFLRKKDDFAALGAILYSLLSGKLPELDLNEQISLFLTKNWIKIFLPSSLSKSSLRKAAFRSSPYILGKRRLYII